MSGVPQPQHCARLRLHADERGGDEGHQRVDQLQSSILLNLFNAVPAGSGDLASPLPQKVLQVEETDRVTTQHPFNALLLFIGHLRK